jgi:hypothetical protein
VESENEDVPPVQRVVEREELPLLLSVPAEQAAPNDHYTPEGLLKVPPGLPHPTTNVVITADEERNANERNSRSKRNRKPVKRLNYRDRGQPRQEFAAVALDIDTEIQPANYREAINGKNRDKWMRAHSEEITRLVDTRECMKFIKHTSKPRGSQASYYNPQVKVKIKDGEHFYRVRGTYGGDKLLYNGEKDAQTAALTTVKLLLNSVVSEGADWMTADISDFYLEKGNKLPYPEYMWINLNVLPENIIEKYNLR